VEDQDERYRAILEKEWKQAIVWTGKRKVYRAVKPG